MKTKCAPGIRFVVASVDIVSCTKSAPSVVSNPSYLHSSPEVSNGSQTVLMKSFVLFAVVVFDAR